MSGRQLIQAAAALVVLIVLWGAFEVVRRLGRDQAERFTLPALTAPDVDTVAILKPNDTLFLVRRDGARWEVNGFAASSTAITELFEALRDTVESDLVARSATTHERLGVDSARGRRMRFVGGGKELLDLVFGGRGREWATVYVRRANEAEVYVLGGTFANVVDKNLDAWRDKRIAAIAADSVLEIAVERGRSRYTLLRGDTAWTVSGARADSGGVARLLQELRDVTATGFPTAAQVDSVDLTAPDRRLVVRGAGGRTLLSLVFDSTSFAYWVRHDSGGPVFRMDSWRADRLVPSDSALRAR